MNVDDKVIAVVGLGYVGLPLAIEFGKRYRTIGYDVSEAKLAHYRRHSDPTGEVGSADFAAATRLAVSADANALADADIRIVAVPPPVDVATLDTLAALYASIITAGVHRAASIKVAEAAKVIENTQRDLNIALMNELSLIFGRIGIDTLEVLQAAGTKWNFLPFRPGLVGGHCIGVDPYYLTHKAEMLGYHPQVILAGRRINDGRAAHVARETVKAMIRSGGTVKGGTVIVLGLTFKENCGDLRNSKVVDVIRELEDFGCQVFVHDPIAEPAEAAHEYGIALTRWEDLPDAADAIVAAVAHKDYLSRPLPDFLARLRAGGVFTDAKSAYDAAAIRAAGYGLWRMWAWGTAA